MNFQINLAAAANKETPKRVLNFLAASESDEIRSAVASNPNTHLITLKSIRKFEEVIDIRNEAHENIKRQLFTQDDNSTLDYCDR